MSAPREWIATDRELDDLARLPRAARDAWCQRRHEMLAACSTLPTIPAKAMRALRRLDGGGL